MDSSQSWNRYGYVQNNPINHNDPDGRCYPLCTAVIGAAVGAIFGAVAYTAYAYHTGQEFNTGKMLLAAGGGAVAGALIGTGAGLMGAATATAFGEGAAAAVVNAGISTAADAAVTKIATGKTATMGQLATSATFSLATSGISAGANFGIDRFAAEESTKAALKIGAGAIYTPVINGLQRRVNHQSESVLDLELDVIGGGLNQSIIHGSVLGSELHPQNSNLLGAMAQLPFTNLFPIARKFGGGDKDLDSIKLWK